MKAITYTQMINGAKFMTSQAADLKQYRIRNKANQISWVYARALRNGRGYFIGTYSEACERFPGANILRDESGKKRIWAFNAEIGKYPRIELIIIK